jgi:hypothetical protein
MEHNGMPQDVLLAKHHGTFHDTPSNKMHNLLKSVPHLSSQIALAYMAKTLSFHILLFFKLRN